MGFDKTKEWMTERKENFQFFTKTKKTFDLFDN